MIANSSTKTATLLETLELKAIQLISEPKYWLAVGVFLNISGITDYLKPLQSLESVIFVAGSLTAVLKIWFASTSDSKKDVLSSISPLVGAIGLGILASTIFSSFLNTNTLQIFVDRGWKHFAKFMILVSLCLMAYPAGKSLKAVYNSLYFGLIVMAGSCLIRFLFFQQFNQESGRMELIGRPGDPNFVCMYMTIGVIFAINYLASAKLTKQKLLHLLAGFLFLTTAWFTESRAGLLVLAVTLLLLLILIPWRFSKWRASTIVTVILTLLVVSFGDRLVERYVTIDDASNSGRWAGIVAGKDMILHQPIWGSGYGSSQVFVQPYLDVLFKSSNIPLEIHTTPLQIAGEQGLVGLLAYGLLYGTLLLLAYRRLRTSIPNDQREIAVICGLATFAIVANMVSIPLSYIGTVHGIALVLLQMSMRSGNSKFS